MYGLLDLELARERRRGLLREAEEGRLAREARSAIREPEKTDGRVRWGLVEDEAAIADLLQLNGMPRWVAFEERFVVAERGGRIVGALRYATESKRLSLGLLVVDPWAGERRTAKALYGGSVGLARELGVAEIFAARTRRADYPALAGYRRTGRGWYATVSSRGTEAPAGGGWRAVLRSFVTTPFRRAFRG